MIREVIINNKKIDTEHIGYKKIILDSSILRNYSHGNIADLLSKNSFVSIKSYGMGGIATPSLRGTGASHTQITWNNININNPMLGQADLSLVPAGLADRIEIYYGGASMALNNGGIGGIINIATIPEWKNETGISVSPEIGSFGNYSGLIKIKAGNMHFLTVTRAYYLNAENDFSYINNEIGSSPVKETRKDSQVRQNGFLQEFYFRKAGSVASAKFWYQSGERNLPASLLSQQVNSGERQSDESFRALMNYDLIVRTSEFSFSGTYMLSRLNYTNKLASISSHNLSQTGVMRVEIQNKIGNTTHSRIILNDEFVVVESNNYSMNSTRNTFSVTASAENRIADKIGTSLLIREIINENKFLIPDFSAGFQFRLIEGKEYFMNANISRNSKIPAMNELYWIPGGNPDLKTEYAIISELTFDMKQEISQSVRIAHDISLFRNNIKDMIEWHPGIYTYWIADNIQNVISSGIETSASVDYSIHNIQALFKAGYSFTNARKFNQTNTGDLSSGKQLVYIPVNKANASLNISYGKIYTAWISEYTGKRYTTADNSRYLPAYFLNNIIAGLKLNLKKIHIDTNLTVINLFNANYQTVAYYPLPGRYYSLKLLFQFIR